MARLWQAVRTHWIVMLYTAGGVLALGAAVFGGEALLSSTAFCTSCHSMSYPAAELRESDHFGAMGADPGCKDCHIPQGLENFHWRFRLISWTEHASCIWNSPRITPT